VEFGRIIVKEIKKKLFFPNFNRIMQKMRKHTKNAKISKNAIMHAKRDRIFLRSLAISL